MSKIDLEHAHALVEKNSAVSFNRYPTTREETVKVKGNLEEDLFNVGCAIQRSSTWIHKYCLRGGGQFLIVEGNVAKELVVNQPGYVEGVLNNRFQTVFVDGGLYKNCITVVRRGEYAKFTLTKPKKIDNGDFPDVTIPEIKIVPTKTRRKDFVCTIHIEKGEHNAT